MNNCIIVHGCPSSAEKAMSPETRTYDKHWMPWVKQELEKAGIPTDIPLMPNPWAPDYQAFKSEFEKQRISENTVLIGHSCGCAFLVKWLGETGQRVSRLILVAPWKISDGDDEARVRFYEYDIDTGIRDRVGGIIMFTSDDEDDDGKRSLEIYRRSLGGKIISLPQHGHYTLGDMGSGEFPELVAAVSPSQRFLVESDHGH